MSSDRPSDPPEPAGAPEEESGEGRMAARLKKLDSAPWLIRAAQALRNTLPGDREYGDRLSVAGSETPQLIGQRLTALTAERQSALREVGSARCRSGSPCLRCRAAASGTRRS